MEKSIFTFFLLSASLYMANGQSFSPFPSSSGNQKMVEQAIKDATGLIKLEYQLQDPATQEKYNRENEDFFGASEGLCIKTKSGWIAPTNVITPWYQDDEIKMFPEMSPVISFTSFMAPGDTAWTKLPVPTIERQDLIPSTALSYVQDTTLFKDGLAIGQLEKEIDGWIVWVSKKGNNLSLKAYSHHVMVSDSLSLSLAHKVIPESAIGGFFVNTTYPSVGAIRFELLGVLTQTEDKWEIVLLDCLSPIATADLKKPKLVPAITKKSSVSDKKSKKKNKK